MPVRSGAGLRVAASVLLAWALACHAGVARAQNPAWRANLIVQPSPSPFLADWNRNPTIAVVTVLYTGRAGQSFRVEAFARSGTAGEIGRVLSPPFSFAFGPSTQLITASDILGWETESSNLTYVNLVERTGRLAEGPIQLCARVLDLSGTQLAQSCSGVTVALPDAPQLIFPSNGGVATSVQPVFQWTPVLVPPEVGVTYHVRIAEVQPQQTPATALSASIPVFDQDVGRVPLLSYPLNALALEPGKLYAWQVHALDQNGLPISRNQGASQIWTFTLGGPGRPPPTLAGAFPDTLTLVPGVATLSGLARASVTETPFAYVLDGQATLNVVAPFQGQVQVELAGLEVDKVSRALRGGALSGSIAASFVPAGFASPFVRFTQIEFDPQAGFTLSASFALPGLTAPLSGSIQLTAAGLSGRLEASAASGAALATLGADPAAFRVQSADVSLPGGGLTLGGTVDLFGQDIGCGSVSGTVDAQGTLQASVACRPGRPVALVPDVSRLQLALSAVSGRFQADLAAGTATYQLTAAGQVALDAGGAACGGSLAITVADGAVTPGAFSPSCDPALSSADLGWLAARLSNLRLQRLSYQPGQGFDFALQVDLAPWLPAVAGFALPSAASVTVDRSGLTVPATEITGTRGSVDVAGFGVQVTHVSLPGFTLSWGDWQAHTAGGFAFSIDGKVTYDGLPQGAPACLAALPLSVTGARLAGGQLTAQIPDQALSPPCDIPLAPGAAFRLEGVSGALGIAFTPQLALTASPSVTGALVLPSFFACPTGSDRTLAIGTTVQLSPQGVLTGHVTGLAPACAIDLASIRLAVTDAALDFAVSGGGAQSAVLTGGATATFTAGTGTVNGSGSVAIDLIQGRLTSGSIAFQGPFELDLPRSPALLAFTVNAASLDSAGLHIDGRGQLRLPNQQAINTTFDQVAVNPLTAAVTSGRILFDAPFALEIGIGADGALAWHALAEGAGLDVASGVRLDLPTHLAVDSAGLSASGAATGHLVFGGRDLDSLAVTFSSNFGLGLNPQAVAAGSVGFAWHGVQVGTVDAQGFHPNLGALATQLLPDRLGLPSASVAYLQLKDAAGNLLVSSQVTSAGVRVFTPPNVTVPLVFPALQLGRATPPQLDVAFDVTVDPLGSGITSGAISARVPSGQAGFDLSPAGLPFAVDSVAYTAGGGVTPPLALTGELALFGQHQAGQVTLRLDGLGTLSGAVDATLATPDTVPLVPGFGGVNLIVSAVTGSFNAALVTGAIAFDLSATTTLAVGTSAASRYRASAVVEVTNREVKVTHLTLPAGADSLGSADLGVVRLGVSGLQVPLLSYDLTSGAWDFDLVFNATIQFPQLGAFALPPVQGIEVTPRGITIPAINMPQLNASPVVVAGFEVTPLAFRTTKAITYNWVTGQGPADWGFGFDLSVGFSAQAPQALQNVHVTVLNAGLTNGVFTGQIEPLTLPSPVVTPWGTIEQIGGALTAVQQGVSGVTPPVQGVAVTLNGHYHYPALLRCSAAPADTMAAVSLTLDAAGLAAGTVQNVVPRCPAQLGPLAVKVTASSLAFSVSAGAQQAELDGTGQVTLPAPTAGATVSATGTIGVDLLTGRILRGSLALTSPFRWTLPSAQPFLTFDVASGRIDSTGFTLSGSSALVFGAGDSVVATLHDVVLGLPDFAIKSGSVSLAGGFSLSAGLSQTTGLQWQAGKLGTAAPTAAGLVVTTPDTVAIDATGLRLGGRASAALTFGGQTYDASRLAVGFDSGFAIGFSPVAVKAGRASLIVGSDVVAYVNASGFQPGNVFGLLPIPDSIPLPDYGTAYLRLRDASGKLLVADSIKSGGIQITTLPASGSQPAGIPLVVPSLAAPGQPAPIVTVAFQIVVNQTTFAPVSGSISATVPAGTPSLVDLTKLGLPLNVTRIAFEASQSAYALHLDAALQLPAALGGASLAFTNLTVTAQGLSGTADLGHYSSTYSASAPVVATATVGTGNTIQFTGVHAVFGGSAQAIQVSGQVLAGLFSAGSGHGPNPIYFTGQVLAPDSVALTVDTTVALTLPLGTAATFTPQRVDTFPAVAIHASRHNFTLSVSGVLALTGVGPQLSLTVGGLSVGTGNPAVSVASVDVGGVPQQLTLFGQQLTIRDEMALGPTCKQAGASYANSVLTVSLSGELQFLGNTSTFCNLQIGTDGSLAITQASLLSTPIAVVPNWLTLDTLKIVTGGPHGPALYADVAVTLPAPLAGPTSDHAAISVYTDGTVMGGTTITVLPPSHAQTFPIGPVTVALQQVDLKLDFAHLVQNSEIDAVAAICLSDGAASCPATNGGPALLLGSVGGTMKPGLVVKFNGVPSVPNISIQGDSLPFDSTFLKLNIKKVQAAIAAPSGHGPLGSLPTLVLTIGGSVGLDLSAVSGGLDFTGFTISSDGNVNFSPSGIKGGDLQIAGVVTLSVQAPAFGRDTTIAVPNGSKPTASSGSATAASDSVPVSFFVSFGGSVSVAGAFSAGVKQVLFYRGTDKSTHFLVDSAAFAIPGVIQMEAELKYDQSGSNWNILVGGSATAIALGNAGVIIVGDIGVDNGKPLVGIFVAATGLQITLTPTPITITGLGGGFFLNPTSDELKLVKQLCNVGTSDTNEIAANNGAAFAILLFASVAIVNDAVITGRALFTITNQSLQIDGAVAVFPVLDAAGARLDGDAHLSIPFGHSALTGTIDVNVDYLGAVKGTGTLSFMVYDLNTWGVNGSFSAHVFSFFDASGSLAISPAGLLLNGTVSGTYTILIASVTGGFGVQVWYLPGGNWGGYLSADLNAQVLGGTLTATGTMTGALINQPGKGLLVFGSGDLKASALGQSWEGSVWVKLENGQPSAGFGDDPAMDAAVASAQQQGQSLNQQTAAVQAAIATAQTNAMSISIPVSELAAAYARVTTFTGLTGAVAVGIPEFAEIHALAPGTDTSYYVGYGTILSQSDAPGDTATVRKLADSVSTGLGRVAGMVSGLQRALGTVQVQTTQLAATAPPAFPARSPVSLSTLRPSSGDSAVATFAVDPTAAQQAASAAQQGLAQAAAYEQAVRQQATAIEGGLAKVRAVLSDTGTTSFLAFVRGYDRVEEAAEEQFARQVDFLLSRKAWAASKDTWLTAQQPTADALAWNAGRHLAALNHCRDDPSYGTGLLGLDLVLVSALSGWTGNQSYLTNFQSDEANTPYGCDPLYVTHAHDYGYALFYTTGDAGLKAMVTSADSIYQVLTQTASTRLSAIRTVQSTVTQDYAQVAQSAAALAGTLHDLYARYVFWKTSQAAGVAASGGTRPSPGSGPTLGVQIGGTGAATTSPSGGSAPATGSGQSLASGTSLASTVGAGTSGTTSVTGARGGLVSGVTAGSSAAVASAIAAQGQSLVPNFDDTNSVLARIGQIDQDLTVPSVTGVQVTPVVTRPYWVKLNVTWTGQHPSGISEYEYRDVAGSSASLTSQFYATGTTGVHSVSLFTPSSTSAGTASRTFEAGVRGGAGFEGYGRSNYTVTFDPANAAACYGCYGASTSTVTSSTAADNTPPSGPVVSFPGIPVITGSDGKTRVWSSDPASVATAWSAADAESGIAEYDYASSATLVYSASGTSSGGSSSGGSTGLRTTTGSTTTTTSGSSSVGSAAEPSWTSAGGRTAMTVLGLHLTALAPTYVVVRARNGQGLVSAVGNSMGLYYDSTPPLWPKGAALTRYGGGTTSPTAGVAATVSPCAMVQPVFPAIPAAGGSSGGATSFGVGVAGGIVNSAGWSGALVAGMSSGSAPGAAVPSASFNMPAAHDLESGLRDYWVRLDRAVDATPDTLHWEEFASNHTAFTVTFPSADYQNAYYVSLVARNQSNQYSAPLVFGPFVATDQTPPTVPTFCAGMGTSAGQLAVQLTAPSSDLETGVRGYQYRVRDAASITVVRNYPATTDTTDWSPVAAGTVLRTRPLTLTDGHQYYVDVRAVNGQGYAGNAIASGPFVYDASSPPTPIAAATYAGGSIALTVKVGADAQSGLMGVQLAVGTTATGADIVPWQSSVVPAGQSTINLATGTLLLGTYYVQVREVNGVGWAGATATTSFTVSPVIPTLPGLPGGVVKR